MKLKFIGAFVMASSVLTGCSDFLVENPQGKLTPETFFATQDDLDMSVSALYEAVAWTEAYTNMQIPQWQGDDLTTNPGSNKQAYAECDRFSPSNTNKGVTDCWNRHNNVIQAANPIILYASSAQASKEEINIALGQAKFWRAYAYFVLVRLFGPLPMNLDNVVDEYTRPLTSVEGVYDQIVKDLTDAETLLPTKYDRAPRFNYETNIYVTQQAAKSMLSAVYMAMAGWPMNKTEYYEQAAAKAKEVINGVKAGKYEYKLEADYKDVYSMGNNYNKETVVGISYSPKVGEWGLNSQMTSSQLFESVGGWGDAWGTYDFWKRFPEGPRKDATYAKQIIDKEGVKLYNFWDSKVETNEKGEEVTFYYIPEKHPMFCSFIVNRNEDKENIDAPFDYTKPNSQNMTNGHRHRLIRYSEVLLWYAEAVGRSGKTDALAFECLNAVRTRAGLEALNGLSAQQLAEAAFDEHGWEVAGYWVALVTRRADMFRMNRLKDVFAKRKANAPVEVASGISFTEPITITAASWSDDMMYMPYPSSDASKNPNLVR